MKLLLIFILIVMICSLFMAIDCLAQVPVTIAPEFKLQISNNAGVPLAGGKVFTYSAGTNPPLASYSDAMGTIPNPNPVILDAGGRASIWLQQASYKIVVQDSIGNQIYSQDNITPPCVVGTTCLTAGNNIAFTGNNTFAATSTFNGSLIVTAGGSLAGTITGAPTFSGNVVFSGNPTFGGSPIVSGNLTATAGQNAFNCKYFENIRCVDSANSAGWTGTTADAWINAAIADLPSTGGVVDARGLGATTQTIASQINVGATGKNVTIFVDRTTTWNCNFNNSSNYCWKIMGGSSWIAFGPGTYVPFAGTQVLGSATVAGALLVQGNQSTNQVGTLVEGFFTQAQGGSTISDALCAVQNTIQVTELDHVQCFSGTTNSVSGKIYATPPSNGLDNPILQNVYFDGQGGTGNKPLLIGCFNQGSTTPSACSQAIQSIIFIGGIAAHAGTGNADVQCEGSNGAGGSNTVGSITFIGYQLESKSTSEVGIFDDGCSSINIHGLYASTSVNAGVSIVKISQPAGTTTDGVNISGIINAGTWTNMIQNTITSNTITTTQCSNGCNYRYTKNFSSTYSNAWEDGSGYQAVLDINGFATRRITATGTAAGLSGTGACGTTSTQKGGAWAGQITCTAGTAASTLVITPGTTAPNGWSCWSNDLTHTLAGSQSVVSTTACTMSFTSVTANDVLTFGAVAY